MNVLGKIKRYAKIFTGYPQLPGWFARFSLVFYIVADRIINAQRVSSVQITSLGEMDDYAFFQISITTVLIFYIFIIFISSTRSKVIQLLVNSPLQWIAMYISFGVLSVIWSDLPALTGFKALQCAVFLITVLVALLGLKGLMERLVYIISIGLAYLISSYFTFFEYVVPEYGINLVTLHFVVGTVPFLGNIYLVKLLRSKKFAMAHSLFITAIAFLETVLTSLIGLLTAQLTFFYVRQRGLLRYLAPMGFVFVVIVLLALIPDGSDDKFLGIKTLDELTQGTGRFEVWQFATKDVILHSPLIGKSFVVGDAIGRTSEINSALGQLHNAHLSAFANLGLIGLGLWLAFLFSTYRLIANNPSHETRAVFSGVAVIYGFQQMFGGASLSSSMHVVWISHALFFSLVAIEHIELSRNRENI